MKVSSFLVLILSCTSHSDKLDKSVESKDKSSTSKMGGNFKGSGFQTDKLDKITDHHQGHLQAHSSNIFLSGSKSSSPSTEEENIHEKHELNTVDGRNNTHTYLPLSKTHANRKSTLPSGSSTGLTLINSSILSINESKLSSAYFPLDSNKRRKTIPTESSDVSYFNETQLNHLDSNMIDGEKVLMISKLLQNEQMAQSPDSLFVLRLQKILGRNPLNERRKRYLLPYLDKKSVIKERKTIKSASKLQERNRIHKLPGEFELDGSFMSFDLIASQDRLKSSLPYRLRNEKSSLNSKKRKLLKSSLYSNVGRVKRVTNTSFTNLKFPASSKVPLEFLAQESERLDFGEFPSDLGSGGGPKAIWPVRRVCEVPGDLLLGGLMMVHERSDTVTCGPVMPQGGIQALETMLYTLDVINSRGLLPFTLGAHILDDCDKDTYGLEMAVDFIKGSISNIDDAEYLCNKTQIRKVISGVVGAASSVTSIQVANLLRLFKIPQVSFWSTSPELSNKQRFEYFSRTIPSDHHQAGAMVEIVKRLGWSYVSIIYEESNYGIKAFEELEQLLARAGVCIAVKEKLAKDSGVAEDTAYDNVVLKLQTKPRARGAIVFASDQEVAGLMKAVRRCNATGSFSWIGSDGWSARSLVSEGSELEVEGTLSVQPQANPVEGFDSYFLNLTVENNKRNPWFVEFWEDHFQCRYPQSPATPYNQRYTRACSSQLRLTRHNTAFENQLQFVSDAVMALTVALGDMHAAMCRGTRGLCPEMSPTKGPDLLRYLRNVNFKGLSGDKFHFDASGDGPARYNIIHFKQTKPGLFQWVHVGEYVEGELRINMTEIQFQLGQPQPPESVCSLPCELGQAKTYVEGESCCWHCFNCSAYQIRHQEDETQCVMCPAGTKPDSFHQACLDIPEDFLRAESAWAIGAMSFSLTGILITVFVTGVFVRHNDTPVVKAAGRELTYVLLVGILLCYLITFALVLRPSDLVCGVQRFGAGFCFTVVYAALLTKTNRISRIFNAGKRTSKRPSFISPNSQIIICSGLVFVQILINGVWMIVSPPRAIHHYPTREDNLLICSSYVDASYMIAFGYPILLILVCTVYAVLTRNIPEAFNESKHIGFTMYTTCVIWLAFVPLYFGTGNNMALRITSMSVTISLSASVTVACLFSPKLYIILIHPERNVRQSMMPNPRAQGSAPAVSDHRVRPTATEVTLVSKTTATEVKTTETTCRSTQTENGDVTSVQSAANGPQL